MYVWGFFSFALLLKEDEIESEPYTSKFSESPK